MQVSGVPGTHPSVPLRPTAPAAGTSSGPAAGKIDTADTVEFSAAARELAGLDAPAAPTTDAAPTDPLRAARLNALREQIAAGTYDAAGKLDAAFGRMLDELA